MKKYIQYNAAQYAGPTTVDAGPRANTVNSEKLKGDSSAVVLDLSGKHGQMPVSMETSQKWCQEQDKALDLSNSSLHMGGESQAEALDLSKSSPSRGDAIRAAPFPASTGLHQSGHSLSQTPPNSSVTRPSSGQYSLLQAALNSTQTSPMVHPSFPDTSCLDSRARMIAALAALEVSRGIKPFASGGPHRFGMPVPPLSYPNPPVTVIQGIHKPIAITAPQPHVSNAESKSQTSSLNTISVSDSNQRSQDEKDGGKLHYTTGIHRRMSSSDKLLLQESYQRDMERYVLQTPKGSVNNRDSKVIPLQNVVEGFSCVQCGKSYKTKAALKLHATVHKTSEERQYECPMCKRRFLHRHHLVVHQRKHSGEKPFKCDACGKTFMAIFLLHKHLRKHVRESGPNCQISSEQLAKLNLKKDTIDVSGIEKIPYQKVTDSILASKRPIHLDDSILPITNAENLAKFHEMNLAMLNKKRDMGADSKTKYSGIEVIDLSSDDLNSSHGSGISKNITHETSIHTDSSRNQGLTLNTQETWGNRNITCTDFKGEEHTATLMGGDSAQRSLIDNCTNANLTTVDLSRDSKTEDTDTSDETEDPSNDVNPFPVYTSNDEVELDFETGELKILSKLTNSSTLENVDCLQNADNKATKEDDKIIEDDIKSSNISAGHNVQEITDGRTVPRDINTSVDLREHMHKGTGNVAAATDSNNTTGKDLYDKNENSVKSFYQPQTISSRTDRNIFEDVGHDTVSKDMNMNEPDSLLKLVSETNDKPAFREVSEPQSEMKNGPGSVDGVEESLKHIANLFESAARQSSNFEKTKRKGRKCRKRSKRVKCEVCSRTFHSDHHLIRHMAVHKKNQMLQSLKKAKAQQMKSMGYQQQKTNVVCQICKKVFKFQKSLNSHMRVHSEKMAKQRLLSKAFRDFMSETVPSSRTTERTASLESPTLCKYGDLSETCDLDPVDLGVKDKLINSNIESRTTDCIEYLAQYSKYDRLEDPPIKVIIGKDNIKRFLCHACDNMYTTKQKLRMHALIHKDNCFLCDICGKSFFRLLTLEKHIATHRLPRPHICMFCKKSFIHRSSLMRHRVIHEKPNTPTVKQQVADINFELKMLDTYTMLREERLQKIQKAKLNELFVDPANSMHHLEREGGESEAKSDILDLSVRIKSDDVNLPPVLSPANTPNNIQVNPLHLSPPVITGETCQSGQFEKQEPANIVIKQEPSIVDIKQEPDRVAIKQEPSDIGKSEMECQSVDKSFEMKKKRTSDEMCGLKDLTPDTFQKKSRKTRVYQTSCRVCKEQFPNVMTLKSHMSTHNMVETHLYECSVCHHRFTQSCSLLRHLKTSCQENRLKCLPCGKTFHLKHSYDQHMKLHNGLPPNLDGSFYDKRKDEVGGIQVKEEKESDGVENNINTKSLTVAQTPAKVNPLLSEPLSETKTTPFQVEPVNMNVAPCDEVQHDLSVKPGPSGLADTNYDSDESDAKTYLYSEGECRMKDMSDFSDSEDFASRLDCKESEVRPQSVESHSSSGVMTLNLLSAVCSDIRNAEKEEETRRREIEERQKELETIEILANLKRGRMQQNNPVPSKSVQEKQNNADRPVLGSFDANSVIQSIIHNQVMMAAGKQSANSDVNVTKHRTSNKNVESLQQNGNKTEPRNVLNIPQIPTVVFEIAAEAERLRQERLAKMGQVDSRNITTLPIKDETKSTEFNPHTQFLHSLAQMTLHDRLALLMKGPLPQLSSVSASISGVGAAQVFPNKSLPSLPTHTLTRPHSDAIMSSASPHSPNNSKTSPQISPHDLSVKKLYSGLTALPSTSPSSSTSSPHFSATRKIMETGSRPSPTVPAFHCELCGKIIYHQMEYQQHLQEHLHNIQLKGQSLMNHHGNAGQRSWILDRAQNLGSPHSHPHHHRENLTKTVSSTETFTPPTTLDLTLKKFNHPVGVTKDVSSPMSSSDFSSDTIPSPSTPSSSASAMNLDVLRKELRNKIYARRRSQGLEDLTVEFKAPEMTEMTEEELVKMDYRRECNRQAAQRSRMRKKDLVDSLIEELHEEEIVHSDLRQKLESLTAEKNYLLKALETHSCVQDKA